MVKSVWFRGIWLGTMAGAVVLAGCNSRSTEETSGNRALQPAEHQKTSEFTPTKIVPSKTPPVVTLAEYNKLETGLSYDAAVKAIGTPGRKSLRSWPEAPRKVMYLWSNADNSNIYVVFDNNKLVEKAQFGLK